MHIMSTNFAKPLVWKHEYDVKLWRHKQRTPNANIPPFATEWTPHENFLRTPLSFYILFPAKGIVSYRKIISSCLYVRLKGTYSLASRALSSICD